MGSPCYCYCCRADSVCGCGFASTSNMILLFFFALSITKTRELAASHLGNSIAQRYLYAESGYFREEITQPRNKPATVGTFGRSQGEEKREREKKNDPRAKNNNNIVFPKLRESQYCFDHKTEQKRNGMGKERSHLAFCQHHIISNIIPAQIGSPLFSATSVNPSKKHGSIG